MARNWDYSEELYPWRLKGCPYPTIVACPCIREYNSFVKCEMQAKNMKERNARLEELRKERRDEQV